jgi:ligand-binding sensor domain-containing protein/signal transduction histidine kinase/AraC-like DNA-binding protein/AmiR/NasT family two-component response regulator
MRSICRETFFHLTYTMAKYIFTFILLLTFLHAVLIAQNLTLPAAHLYQLSPENGLLCNNVETICQDAKGFLWIGSNEGLQRWDGYTFKTYQHNFKDSSGLSSNIIYSILEDQSGQIWVGTITGLNLYNPDLDDFEPIQISSNGESIPVNVIKGATDGKLWLATSNGLCLYNPKSKTNTWYYASDVLPNTDAENVFFALDIDAKGKLWLGTFYAGIMTFDPSLKSVVPYSPNEALNNELKNLKIKKLLIDSKGDIWIGTMNEGAVLLNIQTAKISYPLRTLNKNASKAVYGLFQDKQNGLWVGSADGPLYHKTAGEATFTRYPMPEEDIKSITSLYEDTFGNVWFGTERRGLWYSNRYKNRLGWTKIEANTNANSEITCFLEASDNNVYTGTYASGLFTYSVQNNKATPVKGITEGTIQCLTEDENAIIWIGTRQDGIVTYDPKKQKVVHTYKPNEQNANALIYHDITSIVNTDSLLWIGTYGEGLCLYHKKTNQFLHHENTKSFFGLSLVTPGWINHIFRDSKGRIWLGAYGGLYLFEGQKWTIFKEAKEAHAIADQDIQMIAEDAKGQIWVLTISGGIEKYREDIKGFEHVGVKTGLPLNLKAILPYTDGSIWLSGLNGLIRYDPTSNTQMKLSVSEGLQGQSFSAKACLLDHTGKIFFGGENGFNAFNPTKDLPPDFTINFSFTTLEIKGEQDYSNKDFASSLLAKDKIELAYHHDFIRIHFSDINLFAPGQTQYAYQLAGFNDDWIPISNDRFITLTGLSPGAYTLKVKYTDLKGNWIVADKQLHLHISPPWWQSTLFYWLMAFTMSASIIAVFRWRTNQIKIQNKKLEKEVAERTSELADTIEKLKLSDQTKKLFFNILAHDLKGPINAITALSEILLKETKKLSLTELEEFNRHIYKSSLQTSSLLHNLLEWARTQSEQIKCMPVHLSLFDLTENTIALLYQQARQKNIGLINNCNPEHGAWADQQMMETVLRNLMSNAIKFSVPGQQVSIGSSIQGQVISFTIKDNGKGLNEWQLAHLFEGDYGIIGKGTQGEIGTGLGLILCRDFVERNNGSIEVTSNPGIETTFTITLPLANIIPDFANQKKETEEASLAVDGTLTLEPPLYAGQKEKILIIDDNEAIRFQLKNGLQNFYEINEAENGKEGLELAKALQPFAIITDLMMPLMDGNDLSRELKSNQATSHIPVILMTSMDREPSEWESYRAGVDFYLQKPVQLLMLKQILENCALRLEKLKHFWANTSVSQNTESIPASGPDQLLLNKLIDIIDAQLGNAVLNPEWLAREIGLSRSLLYAKFKSLTGFGINEFVQTRRLIKSKTLLEAENLSINDIAHEIGFSSASYFIKCFSKEYGKTPNEYRQALKK